LVGLAAHALGVFSSIITPRESGTDEVPKVGVAELRAAIQNFNLRQATSLIISSGMSDIVEYAPATVA
jgi:hypothetical protein